MSLYSFVQDDEFILWLIVFLSQTINVWVCEPDTKEPKPAKDLPLTAAGGGKNQDKTIAPRVLSSQRSPIFVG